MKIIKPKINIRYIITCSLLFFIPYYLILLPRVNTLLLQLEFILLYFGMVAFFTLLFKIFYKYIEFSIDDYKISRINSFISYKRIDIRYEDIQEINLKYDFLQRIGGLGDILMLSNATTEKAGIKFFNIENPIEVYEEIQNKIDQCKKISN